jgi:hypothetical protein
VVNPTLSLPTVPPKAGPGTIGRTYIAKALYGVNSSTVLNHYFNYEEGSSRVNQVKVS